MTSALGCRAPRYFGVWMQQTKKASISTQCCPLSKIATKYAIEYPTISAHFRNKTWCSIYRLNEKIIRLNGKNIRNCRNFLGGFN